MKILRDDGKRIFSDIKIGEGCIAVINDKKIPMLKISNNFELPLEYSSINKMWHVHKICPTAEVFTLPNPYIVYGNDNFSSLDTTFGQLEIGDAFYILGSDTMCIKVCADGMDELLPDHLKGTRISNTIEFDITRNHWGERLIGGNRLLKYYDDEPVRFLPEAKMIFRY